MSQNVMLESISIKPLHTE